MAATLHHGLYAGRGYVRRAVELPCELVTTSSDQPDLSWGVDLSESGIFLESERPLQRGEGVVVGLAPPVGWSLPELVLFGEVARAVHGRRREDAKTGMAVRFLDLGPAERRALSRWLRPRPRAMSSVRGVGRVSRSAPAESRTDHPFAARLG